MFDYSITAGAAPFGGFKVGDKVTWLRPRNLGTGSGTIRDFYSDGRAFVAVEGGGGKTVDVGRLTKTAE